MTAKVLEVVADKTGYPQDMLDLELDLEADLGIDTVKQAETFAAIREAFDIPRAGEPVAARLSRRCRAWSASSTRSGPTLLPTPGRAAVRRRPTSARRQKMPRPMSRRRATMQATRYSIEDANRIPRRVPVPVLRPATELVQVETGRAARAQVHAWSW